MDEGRKYAILFAATILCARKLIDMDPNKPNMAKGYIVDKAIEDAAITNEPALRLAARLDRHARRYPIVTTPMIPAMIASPNNFSGGYIAALYDEPKYQSMPDA